MQHRKRLRLARYDYSQNGFYFVTVCVHKMQSRLGEVKDGYMAFNECGQAVRDAWCELPNQYSNCILDEFIVMPNHMHGIIQIAVGAGSPGPYACPGPRHGSLVQMMAWFKYQSTKRINGINHSPGNKVWQRSYHDRIIRNERELTAFRQYIVNNPMNWDNDKNNIT